MRGGTMKKRTLFLATSLILASLAVATASAFTYASFVKSADINQDIGSAGWKQDTIFLDGTPSDNSGDWNNDNAIVCVFAMDKNNNDSEYDYWIESDGVNASGYYYFRLPLAAYTHILFARIKPDHGNPITFSNDVWNLTNDLSISDKGANNLYSLSTYGNGVYPGWTKATGSWSVLS